MDMKDFAFSLCKILSEEIPLLQFTVTGDNHRINVTLPETLVFSFSKEKCYIGMDDLKDKVEVYARYGLSEYENFGKVTDPQKVLQPIEKFLYMVFGDVIKRSDALDFSFSQELQDFLKYNHISVRTYKEKQPHLIIDHPEFPYNYTIDFSEYKGDVLVEIYKRAPIDKKSFTSSDFLEGEQERLYRSDLSAKNQQKVFSEILALLRKEGIK